MDKLKPCPLCGGEARIEHGLVTWAVVCQCSSHVFYGCEKDKAKTIEAWNTRAERTCKQLRIFNLIKRECDGEHYQWHGDEMPNYCPNCGAKVVDA